MPDFIAGSSARSIVAESLGDLQFVAFLKLPRTRRFEGLDVDGVLRWRDEAVEAEADLAYAAAHDDAEVRFGFGCRFAKSVVEGFTFCGFRARKSSILARATCAQLGGILEPVKMVVKPKNLPW